MEQSNEFLDSTSELHEHHAFTVEKGQQPLRIDKYLMNFVENFIQMSYSNSCADKTRIRG